MLGETWRHIYELSDAFLHVLKVLLLKKGLRIITTRKTNFSVGGGAKGANTFSTYTEGEVRFSQHVVFAKFRDVF